MPSCVVTTPSRCARARPSDCGSTPTIATVSRFRPCRSSLIMRSVPMFREPMIAIFTLPICFTLWKRQPIRSRGPRCAPRRRRPARPAPLGRALRTTRRRRLAATVDARPFSSGMRPLGGSLMESNGSSGTRRCRIRDPPTCARDSRRTSRAHRTAGFCRAAGRAGAAPPPARKQSGAAAGHG